MQSQTGTAQVRRLAKQAGFSLVELMVVVAIIGVLATIAIPRVNRFIAKSRQSEAQVNLSSLYTFNKNFFVEFQGYTNAFASMGYRPEGNLRYNVGFANGQAVAGPGNYAALKAPAVLTGPVNSLADCPVDRSNPRCVTLLGSDGAAPPSPVLGQLTNNNQNFTAQAIGRLITTVAACAGGDSWTITDSKNLRNVCDGTQD